MSTHVPYLEDLVNHIKNDVNLPELIGKYVFVKSQYRGIDEDNQCAPAIWIIPGATNLYKAPNNRYDHDCKGKFVQDLKICAVVRCPNATRNHFDQSVSGTVTTLLGPYVMGADLLCRARQSVLDFNQLNNSQGTLNPCYSPLQLTRIYEPDEHNGHLIHCMEYELTFIY